MGYMGARADDRGNSGKLGAGRWLWDAYCHSQKITNSTETEMEKSTAPLFMQASAPGCVRLYRDEPGKNSLELRCFRPRYHLER